MEKTNLKKYLYDSFDLLNIKLNTEQIDKIKKYIDFLIKENKKYNLTAIKKPYEIIDLHFIDSAMGLTKYNIEGKIIDIGTGAGFPGFVFKILKPNIELTLLDSSLKKINFLKMLQIEIDLSENIELIHGRAEDYGHESKYRFKYDYVLSRAVAPLAILLEYTACFCKLKGKILLYKGPNYKDELKEAENAIEKLNLKLKDIYSINHPNIKGERYLLELSFEGKLNDKYPRRSGIPKKRPL
ncbi:MAG: 16S rRNA (guanine(527)-N(7))-methyltransferase RsmG [Halanaerobiales bacterium]|nr:16S rRNA (guanine(527)-N(7))-methyltransferase RsmG [Halanaerobiales bacterium]